MLPVGLLLVGLLTIPAARAQEQPVVVDSIEVRGNTRTSRETIFRYLPLRPGDRVPSDSLVAAVEQLRESHLFRTVEFSSRRGAERGHLILEISVEERRVEFHFGAGYQALGGWYLIPAELRFDNRLGTGEQLRLQFQIGHRTAGLNLSYEQPRFGDGRNHWGVSFGGGNVQRVYFLNGVPYGQDVGNGHLEMHVGRRLTAPLSIEFGAGWETTNPDSSARATAGNRVQGIDRGDRLPFEELPAGIAEGVGRRGRARLRADLGWDSRAELRAAATPASGAWGRLRIEEMLDGNRSFPRVTVDLRGYRAAGAAALAGRLQGGIVDSPAPFYDRFYLGGQSTLRGFPGESQTRPAGDTKYWGASLELRAPMIGPRENPRLAGLLFVDAADSWSRNSPRWDEVSVGAGWGLRYRAGWLGWLGLDVGVPLTPSPYQEAFRIHGALGLTY